MALLGDALFAAFFAAVALAVASEPGTRTLERVLPVIDRFAARPVAPLLFCGLLSFIGSAAVALFVMWPEPRVHDEFSYLLMADTFAHGRLANPTHPMWQHFESFHIFHEPTYASKYPPAQGAMLALGILLAKQPIVGIWLSGALMCAAIFWTMRAFVAPRWALLGAVAATFQIGIATAWTQTMWGGAVAALGGTLVIGGATRLAKEPRTRDAIVAGLGLVVLANSRPFEGVIASLAAAVFVALSCGRDLARWRRALVPVLAVLALGAVAMAKYDSAITGHWWLPPYLHHEQIYAFKPTLAFQSPNEGVRYRHAEMRYYYTGSTADEEPSESEVKTDGALTSTNADKISKHFSGRALLLPFVVGLLVAATRRDVAMLAATIGLGVATLLLLHFFQLHYVSPFTGAVFALVAVGLERLDAWRPSGRRIGTGLCVGALIATIGGLARDIGRVEYLHTGWGYDDTAVVRPQVVAKLRATPGRDLVIVQYGPLHDVSNEWVYNDADIDASEIVWARDMGEERNRELLAYFHDRRVWVYRKGFSADEDGLKPYEGPSG